MGLLFKRSAEIIAGDIKISTGIETSGKNTLKIQFKVEKSLTKNANSCEVKIFNLSEKSRARIDELSEDVAVSVKAGYQKDLNQIFLGERGIARSINNIGNAEWITTITLGDAATKIRKQRSKISLAGNTEVTSALDQLILDIELNSGNVIDQLKKAATGENSSFKNGFAFSGKTMDGIDAVLKKLNLQISVQDGVLQALGPKQTNFSQELAPVYTPSTGLIGAPESGDEGNIRIRVLLDGKIKPGDRFIVESKKFKARSPFKALSVIHTGDTYGQAWWTDIEGLPLEQ